MHPTTEQALSELFTAEIVKIAPREQYKGAEGWKPYDRDVNAPTRTRRFRLLWDRPRLLVGGAMAGGAFEHVVTLRVRTDYVGDHSQTQFAIVDDHLQLRDVLSRLKSTDNGVMLVSPVNYAERQGFTASSDVAKIDHTFEVRYLRRIEP